MITWFSKNSSTFKTAQGFKFGKAGGAFAAGGAAGAAGKKGGWAAAAGAAGAKAGIYHQLTHWTFSWDNFFVNFSLFSIQSQSRWV